MPSSSSRLEYEMTSRPRRPASSRSPPWPRASRASDSVARRATSGSAARALRFALALAPDARDGATRRSVSRTDSPCATTRAAAPTCCAGGSPSSARACPMSSLPDAQIVLHRLRELAQAQQVGDRAARAPDRLRRRVVRQPEFVDQPREPVRLLQRIQVLALDVLDQRHRERRLRREPSRTSAGTSFSPARCAARQRRSPAMISKRPPSTGRTRIGCMMPCSRIELRELVERRLVHPRARLILARPHAIDARASAALRSRRSSRRRPRAARRGRGPVPSVESWCAVLSAGS